MIDLGFITTNSAIVGQTYTFSWEGARMLPNQLQMANGIVDHVVIVNPSGNTFKVTMNQSQRSFTLPAGSWSDAMPLSWMGTTDNNCTLTVENVTVYQASSQVHFDYYYPGEPITVPQAFTQPQTYAPPAILLEGQVALTATSTWTDLGPLINIHNFPFSNSLLSAGQATSGQFAILYNGSMVSVKGFAANGTTVEAARIQVRVAVQDSAAAIVSTYTDASNGALHNSFHSFFSDASTSIASFAPTVPGQKGVIVAAGAGPNYSLRPQVFLDSQVGLTAPNLFTVIVVLMVSVVATIYPLTN